MTSIDIDNLNPFDIPVILELLHDWFMKHDYDVLTENVFLTPEMIAKRYEISVSVLNHWRVAGGGPNYVKLGNTKKGRVRYPLLGKKGLVQFEKDKTFSSTSEESYSRENSTT